MAFYKVLKNQEIIDTVKDDIVYVKYQKLNKILLSCPQDEAMGFASDGGKCYHLSYLRPFPIDDYESVSLEEISELEYENLKKRNLMSIEEIREELLTDLLERGII